MPHVSIQRHLVLAVAVFIPIALFSPAADATADQKELIQQAYEKTKNATSIADFDTILQLCAEAHKGGLNSPQESYVKSLIAWAQNRRGELYTEQASAAQQRGEKERAAELDGKALADFEAAIDLDATRWKPWHNRGVSYAIAGKYQNAIADFTKVIELNTNYPNAWFNRGEIYYDVGQLDQALKDYSEAIRLNPKDAGAYTSRAHTLFRLDRFKEALTDYTKAYELAPDATTLANRGDAYQSLGQWGKAAEDFNQALQLDAESPRALQCAAWLLATCPDDLIRNQKYAVEAAEKAVELNGEPNMRYLDTLAAAYANAGRFDEAVAKVKEAIAYGGTDETPPLKKRLELYQQQRPYRQPGNTAASTTAPQSAPARATTSAKKKAT